MLFSYSRFPTAEDVLDYYGRQRTVDRKGVTIPSQRRYINYYSSVVREALDYRPVKLYLRSLVIDPVPAFGNLAGHEFYLQFEVSAECRACRDVHGLSRPHDSPGSLLGLVSMGTKVT